MTLMREAYEPSEPPKTRVPGLRFEWKEDGEERMVPANSRPRTKDGVTRERLFWCLPRALRL